MSVHNLIFNLINANSRPSTYASSLLYNTIQRREPCMIARFGSNEIKAVLYPLAPKFVQRCFQKRLFYNMETGAGFFPATDEMIQKFSRLMIEDMKYLDILGSWRIEERLLTKYTPTAKRVTLPLLEPYLSQDPWSKALEGRNVLVIHPFAETIQYQYENSRQQIFQDPRILPEFASLRTIKAVQTIAGQKSSYKDWFEALQAMKEEIDSVNFDIAILGCGAYGFPLAAHIKRLGRQAFHLGGPTQLLFGIKGKRWDNHPTISKFYNNHWTRPNQKERPTDAAKVEGACYW